VSSLVVVRYQRYSLALPLPMRARERAGIPKTGVWTAREVNVTTNTTEIGDELRDHVIDLLLARGVKIDREVRIGSKKLMFLRNLRTSLIDEK
jgi:hypothetical protein